MTPDGGVTADRIRFGGHSMTEPLREVLIVRPGRAFGAAFDDPALGFLHPVDLALARREHAELAEVLSALGCTVHVVEAEELGTSPDAEPGPSADAVYAFDPVLVTDRGVVALRPGKPSRRAEVRPLEGWLNGAGVPTAGRIEPPGTVEGGDTLWLRPDLFCIGRSLRTDDAGARELSAIVGGDVRVFDLPYWRGSAELVHLLSVISPVADDLAVVFPPLLPVGLWRLLRDLGIRTLDVPEEEYVTLGCNVLAVRPGVVVVADGNPATAAALAAAGCEVHAIAATEIGLNGSGGPTCLTRPILRG